MSEDKHKQIYDNIKNIAKQYDIKVLIPKGIDYNSARLEDNLFPQNKTKSITDNFFAITIDKSSNNNNNNIIIMKNGRKQCEITKYIKEHDIVGLEDYLEKLYTQKQSNNFSSSLYDDRFINNFSFLLTTKPTDAKKFFEILENSKLFQSLELDKDNLWMKVAFEAEDYVFLRNKVKMEYIIKNDSVQTLIKQAKNNTLLEKLLEEQIFVDYLENNLQLNKFMGYTLINNLNEKDCLEIILNKINMKNKINFTRLASEIHIVNKSSLQFKWFNANMKTLILHSNYEFTKEDESLEVFNEETQQLISKKVLNAALHKNLVPKQTNKRKKI